MILIVQEKLRWVQPQLRTGMRKLRIWGWSSFSIWPAELEKIILPVFHHFIFKRFKSNFSKELNILGLQRHTMLL